MMKNYVLRINILARSQHHRIVTVRLRVYIKAKLCLQKKDKFWGSTVHTHTHTHSKLSRHHNILCTYFVRRLRIEI